MNKYINALAAALGAAPKKPEPIPKASNYPLYLKENMPSPKELEMQRRASSEDGIMFSVVIDAAGASLCDIGSTLISLYAQTYPHFEGLLIVDETTQIGCFIDDERIITAESEDGGIACADRMVSGGAVIRLAAGDRLSPDALYRFAKILIERPDIMLVYSDNDRIIKGERVCPRFKPAYSPVSEFCFDHIQRPLCARNVLHELSGGYSAAGSQHIYTLKCFEKAGHAVHIPGVLLSIKHEALPTEPPIPPKCFECLPGSFSSSYRLIHEKPVKGKTAIVIPDTGSASQLKNCLECIDVLSVKRKHDIMIGLGKRPDKELEDYLSSLKRNRAATVIELFEDGEITVPRVLNECASRAAADHFVFMSAAIEIVSCDFIDELLCPLMLSGVGVSGGKLLCADGKLLHTGYVIGVGGWAESLYPGTEDDRHDETKCFYTAMQRNVSAVSGAFMAVNAETFLRIGMFDESFEEVGWDIEFCLRARERGLDTIWTPFAAAKLLREPKSFGEASKKDLSRCYDVMRETLLTGDPYYNTAYDCRFTTPIVSIKPTKPIVLNPNF